jgi:hypothetical protein
MKTLREFFELYRLYRYMHGMPYALKRAYQICFRGLPF